MSAAKEKKRGFVQVFGLATTRRCWGKFLGSVSRKHLAVSVLFPARGNQELVVPRNAYGLVFVKIPDFFLVCACAYVVPLRLACALFFSFLRAPAWDCGWGWVWFASLPRSWRKVQRGNYHPRSEASKKRKVQRGNYHPRREASKNPPGVSGGVLDRVWRELL